jgi:hypothetical protein
MCPTPGREIGTAAGFDPQLNVPSREKTVKLSIANRRIPSGHVRWIAPYTRPRRCRRFNAIANSKCGFAEGVGNGRRVGLPIGRLGKRLSQITSQTKAGLGEILPVSLADLDRRRRDAKNFD